MAKSFTPLHSNMQNHWPQHKNMLSKPKSIEVSNPFADTNLSITVNEIGNVYKMLSLPPWHDIAEPKKGGNLT